MDETFAISSGEDNQAVAPQPRSLEELIADRERLYQQEQVLDDELRDQGVNLNDVAARVTDERPGLWEQIADHRAVLDPDGSGWSAILGELRQVTSEADFNAFAAYLEKSHQLRDDIEALEEEAREPATQRLAVDREYVMTHTNWAAVVEAISARGWNTPIDPPLMDNLARAAHSNARPGDLASSIIERAVFVQQVRADLEGSDFMFEGAYSEAQLEMLDAPDIQGDAQAWERATYRAIRYLSLERRKNLGPDLIDSPLVGIEASAAAFGLNNPSWRTRPAQAPRMVIELLQSRLDDFKHNYDAADRRYIQEAHKTRPDTVRIVGTDLLVETTTNISDDPLLWMAAMLRHLQPGFYAGLSEIECIENFPSDSPDADYGTSDNENPDNAAPSTEGSGKLTKGETAGEYLSHENRVQVSALTRRYRDFLEDLRQDNLRYPEEEQLTDEQLIDLARTNNTRMVRRVLYHEITHYATDYTIPIDVLRAWGDVIDSEDVDVTLYITYHREKGSHAGTIEEEDMCETVASFLTDPEDLFWRAPKRFAFCNDLLNRFDERTLAEVTALKQSTTPETEEQVRKQIEWIMLLGAHLPY